MYILDMCIYIYVYILFITVHVIYFVMTFTAHSKSWFPSRSASCPARLHRLRKTTGPLDESNLKKRHVATTKIVMKLLLLMLMNEHVRSNYGIQRNLI